MRSSYMENNYGEVLKSMIMAYRPIVCVELGVLDGYSALHIAAGIKENQRLGVPGHLDAYDLFEDYPFNHGSMEAVHAELFAAGLADLVNLLRGDAYQVFSNYADNSVHFLHVDLSNTGKTIREIMQLWDPKVVVGSIVVFEGGSEERDKIDWMIKYAREPMKPEIETNKIIFDRYIYGTYLEFPSMTCLLKKR